MLKKTMHSEWFRILTLLAGTLLAAFAINTFITPQHLYSGGLLGLCQLIREGLDGIFGLKVESFDIAAVLFQLTNIPLFFLAWKTMGRTFSAGFILSTVVYTAALLLIPVPEKPLLENTLASCLVGGILNGAGNGIVLACSGSIGGIGVLWLYFSKRWGFSVGHIHMVYSAALCGTFFVLFDPETAIYSSLFAVVTSMYMDRTHLQNISVQALVVTKGDVGEMTRSIIRDTRHDVTYWEGFGAYTGDGVHILCVCLTKYELDQLNRCVRAQDPHAFITVQEGVHIKGNFNRHLT
ncbi:MAG: YitT family protein [Lachnospiraceae bacterium]|nr:YitT family protein [Lachnospiraceae bacterium]